MRKSGHVPLFNEAQVIGDVVRSAREVFQRGSSTTVPSTTALPRRRERGRSSCATPSTSGRRRAADRLRLRPDRPEDALGRDLRRRRPAPDRRRGRHARPGARGGPRRRVRRASSTTAPRPGSPRSSCCRWPWPTRTSPPRPGSPTPTTACADFRDVVARLDITQNRMAHASELVAQIGAMKVRYAESLGAHPLHGLLRAKGQSLWNAVNILVELILR